MNKLNFSAEYSEWSDDEILLLASARDSLTREAATALDAELRRRNLTQSDQAKYQQFVKRNEQRAARRRRRRGWGILWEILDLFWALVAMALISLPLHSLTQL